MVNKALKQDCRDLAQLRLMANLDITPCPPIISHKGVNNITVQLLLSAMYTINNKYNIIQHHDPYISCFFNSKPLANHILNHFYSKPDPIVCYHNT